MFHEFTIDRSKLVLGASLGVALLLFGVFVSWLCWTFGMPAGDDVPFFDFDKPSWVSLVVFFVLIASLFGAGCWALGIAWRNWRMRLQLHDEGLVWHDRDREQFIGWGEIAAIQEHQLYIAPAAHHPLQLLTLPLQEVQQIRSYLVCLKDGTSIDISGMRGESVLKGILVVQAQKHNIPWQVTVENQ